MWSWIVAGCLLFLACITVIIGLSWLAHILFKAIDYKESEITRITTESTEWEKKYIELMSERNDLFIQLHAGRRNVNIQMEVPQMRFDVRAN